MEDDNSNKKNLDQREEGDSAPHQINSSLVFFSQLQYRKWPLAVEIASLQESLPRNGCVYAASVTMRLWVESKW